MLENNYFIATSFFLSLERQAVILSRRVGASTALPGGRGSEGGGTVPGRSFSLTSPLSGYEMPSIDKKISRKGDENVSL